MSVSALDIFQQDLESAPVIAILRGVTSDEILPVCNALVQGGVRFIEVTLNSPNPIASIGKAAQALASRGVHVGAGTVLTADDVDRVAEAGGTYIISPNTDGAVIRRTKERGLISIPGFMTPSEAFAAAAAGADILKCFPIGCFGPAYIKDLKAVLPTPVAAVGGVNVENVQRYLQAGAVAVGVGSSLYKAGLSSEQIQAAAAAFMQQAGAV